MSRNQKIIGTGVLATLVALLGPTLGIPYLIVGAYRYLSDKVTGEDGLSKVQTEKIVTGLAGEQYEVDCFGNLHALRD